MTVTRKQPGNFQRTTALLLAFVFLWMATIGTVMHSHEYEGLTGDSSSRAVLHTVTASSEHGPCAACEWTAAMQVGSFTVCTVSTPPDAYWRQPQSHFALIRSLMPVRRSPRAPPIA